ncbi:MAG: iron-sulfur cluster assembly scaffold protein, partial [Candidatus Aenigmatarchaeota archaeon]
MLLKRSGRFFLVYRDEILDLYKHPRNEGILDTDIYAEGENPSCGDQV